MARFPALLFSLILFCLFPFNMEGQVQKNFLDVLSEKFSKYCSSFPWEEIYVHTDRQEYIAGEDVWFEAYLVDRQSLKPSADSKIVYIEILNAENRPVAQKRIMLDNAAGAGRINLSDTLSSGYYTIRAYTNWMKNFLPYNCFIKRLLVFNALNNNKTSFSVPHLKEVKKTAGTSMTESGLTVKVIKQDSENVKLSIYTNQNFRSRVGNILYLIVQTRGNINLKRSVNLTDDNYILDFPANLLIPGIHQITFFNASGKPVTDHFFYTPSRVTDNVTLTSPDSIKVRDKLSLDIGLKNASGEAGNFQNISISITPRDEMTFADMAEYMIFGSEFGEIPDEILQNGIDKIPAGTLDNYLSAIKSNWINWNTILSADVPQIKYRKEIANHYIYGKLLKKNTQAPDEGRYLFLSMPGKHATFQYARTDKNGNFDFTIPLDNNNKDLIIQPEEVGRNNTIKIESSFSNVYPEIYLAPDPESARTKQIISKLGINYQVLKIYKSDDLPQKSNQVVFTGGLKRFYGKPEIELIMDDYIKLPVMQEVFFELMPGVFLKKKKTGYEITIADPVENQIYDKPPILFVDGVVVNDAAVIANLDPELVEKIDAVKTRYFVGDYLFYGLVNVITRAGNFTNVTLPDYAVRLPYKVTESAGTFSSPDYSSAENKGSRIPDFRNTLYWNSSIKPDKDGKARVEFWTSDFKSDYEINIQGFTGGGEFVSFKKVIRLK
jgi:hypothetical protein